MNKALMYKLTVLVLAIVLSVSAIAGGTYAWFTDAVTTGINKIEAGNLDLEVLYKNNGAVDYTKVDEQTDLFVYPTLWEPGAVAYTNLKIQNVGNLALKASVSIEDIQKNFVVEAGATEATKYSLTDVLKIAFVDEEITNQGRAEIFNMVKNEGVPFDGELSDLDAIELYPKGTPEKDFEKTYGVVVYWAPQDNATDNLYNLNNGKSASDCEALSCTFTDDGKQPLHVHLGINVEAIQKTYEEDSFNDQYDAAASNKWNGTADTSWYNDTDTEFVITTAEQLAGFAELVDGGKTFEGKTVKLGKDIDLYAVDANGEPISFNPIGGQGTVFKGTLDGQDYSISNMYQSGWAFGFEWGKYGSIGLFAELDSATIKNLTIDNAEGEIEGGDIGGITGSATGNCNFENITVKNTSLGTYNNGIGGIIGWSGAGTYNFKNINIEETTVLGGLWGSFDSSIGGVVGQAEPGATYNFENVNIACRLDAYNDVTASYDYYNYRMCGMIMGRLEETTTIDGAYYPDVTKYKIDCKNVTVTYGDWANYHYCRAEGERGKRVESGYAYGGIPADYDHSVCTVHHMELIAFDQIFGGDQFGVKGLKEYDGVTVVYNNK